MESHQTKQIFADDFFQRNRRSQVPVTLDPPGAAQTNTKPRNNVAKPGVSRKDIKVETKPLHGAVSPLKADRKTGEFLASSIPKPERAARRIPVRPPGLSWTPSASRTPKTVQKPSSLRDSRSYFPDVQSRNYHTEYLFRD